MPNQMSLISLNPCRSVANFHFRPHTMCLSSPLSPLAILSTSALFNFNRFFEYRYNWWKKQNLLNSSILCNDCLISDFWSPQHQLEHLAQDRGEFWWNMWTKTTLCRQYLFKQIFQTFHSFNNFRQLLLLKISNFWHQITDIWTNMPLYRLMFKKMYHGENVNTFQTITVQAPSHHNVLGAVKGPELPLLGQVSMMLMLMLMLRPMVMLILIRFISEVLESMFLLWWINI